jgi:hypothetical protein
MHTDACALVYILLFIYRLTALQQPPSCQFHKFSPVVFCSSKHEGLSDKDCEGAQKSKKNEEAIKKLNLLLKSMAEVR